MISVIIPVHNGIKTLDRAVQSVLNQTICRAQPDSIRESSIDSDLTSGGRQKVEILLVDDGSEQETAKRCDELAGVCPSRPGSQVVIKVFHMEDRGVSAARNLGLQNASGDFITFLDDDDAMEPEMLGTLLEIHNDTGADICGCGFRTVQQSELFQEKVSTGLNDDSDKEKQKSPDGIPETDQDAAGIKGLARKYSVFHGSDIITKRILRRDTRVWSKLFARQIIFGNSKQSDFKEKFRESDNRFLEGLTIGEDMLFVLSLIRKDTSYALTEAKLYDYTINPKGAMERPFTRSYMDQIRCWDEAEKVIRKNFPDLLDSAKYDSERDRENSSGSVKTGSDMILSSKESAKEELNSLRVVSDILTASKIARLPEKEWKMYQPEFQTCREKLKEHCRASGVMQEIPNDYRMKAVILEHFPAFYRRLYRLHG